MEKLWDRNIGITLGWWTRDDTDAAEGRALGQTAAWETRDSSLRDERHHEGNDTFANAAKEGALKVVLTTDGAR